MSPTCTEFSWSDTEAPCDEFRRFVAALDVSEWGEADIAAGVSGFRLVQRALDGLFIRFGSRTRALAEAGESVPVEDRMRDNGSVPAAQARRDAKRAETADALPGLGDAVSSGETSGAHVDVIARATADLTQEQRDRLDVAGLVEKSKSMPVEAFRRVVKRAVDGVTTDHGLADTKKKQAAAGLRWWFDNESGMGRVSGQFDPESYEKLTTAVEQQMAAMAAASDGTVIKNNNLAARALIELVTGSHAARNRLPSITVIVDHKTMTDRPHEASVRETEGGHDVAPETVSRLFCDAVVQRVVLNARGVPVDVGRKSRTATDAQWAAVKATYDTCGWDGCTAPLSWCQLHHIHEWGEGGSTDLCNLVPLCSKHHHRVHEGKWSIKLLKDRRLQIYRPDGSHHATVPTPQRC